MVVLKRLDDALRDGDPIQALLLASGTNQDGRTNGITMPNPDAQESLLREVYAGVGIPPSRVSYVEAHGTGTPVGDPAEAFALGRVCGAGRPASAPMPMGSVKTNFGHLEWTGIHLLVETSPRFGLESDFRHIREDVPYGSKGWKLKVGFTKLPNGGSCAKTCHDTRTYNNKTLTSSGSTP